MRPFAVHCFYGDFMSPATIQTYLRPRIVSNISQILIFARLEWKFLVSNFTKIRPVGTEMIYADGRTNMRKPIDAFRDFPKFKQAVQGGYSAIRY